MVRSKYTWVVSSSISDSSLIVCVAGAVWPRSEKPVTMGEALQFFFFFFALVCKKTKYLLCITKPFLHNGVASVECKQCQDLHSLGWTGIPIHSRLAGKKEEEGTQEGSR
jgi:hypothetical protein